MRLQDIRARLESMRVGRDSWPAGHDLIKLGETKDKAYKIVGQLSKPRTFVFDSFDLYEVEGLDGAKELIKLDIIKLKILRRAEVESWKLENL